MTLLLLALLLRHPQPRYCYVVYIGDPSNYHTTYNVCRNTPPNVAGCAFLLRVYSRPNNFAAASACVRAVGG